MRILAADTSTSIITVAVCEDGAILAESVVECGRAHSERLLATVDWVIREASVTLRDIDLLAISVGPGSFTGIRIGIATWKGLALGTGKPLAGVPTLDAMSRLPGCIDGTVCPILDARMGEIFGAVYRFRSGVREKLVADCVCPIERVLGQTPDNTLFLGNGATLYRERILSKRAEAAFSGPLHNTPRASAIALEAAALVALGCETDPGKVAPIYLRKSQAEENRAKAGTDAGE
jgi:tRNA threonylcarbamoyladenosine biosynthesis protein TsaB